MNEPRLPSDPPSDPRAVRVTTTPSTALPGDPVSVIAPAAEPGPDGSGPAEAGSAHLVDGEPAGERLLRLDQARGRLEVSGEGGGQSRTNVLFGPSRPGPDRGTTIREVVVDGWRFEVQVEMERLVRLREQARRGDAAGGAGGPVTVRSVIPGRVVAVSVKVGDAVAAGQQILVVEAMKMQNEIRAPREGCVERIGVAVGDTIEVGDLLVVIH
jgi:biotin carboxyl carrier protein